MKGRQVTLWYGGSLSMCSLWKFAAIHAVSNNMSLNISVTCRRLHSKEIWVKRLKEAEKPCRVYSLRTAFPRALHALARPLATIWNYQH